ncbi:hypothetical protein [Streptomyces sp. NPDC002564]|uniref:hypothetical protein n=1 Tax=Streptomyces sp. NPDC002564 TaxID=3364649 RepID=UPI0036CBA1A1
MSHDRPGPPGQPRQAVRGDGRKRTGFLVGAVAVLVAAAAGGYVLLAGTDAGSSEAGAGRYELTAPPTVLGGSYRKAGSSGADGGLSDAGLRDLAERGVRGAKAVGGRYTAGSSAGQKALTFSGVYGTVEDPEKVVDGMFAELRRTSARGSGGVRLLGVPQVFTPAGFDEGVMKCQRAEFRPGPADRDADRDGKDTAGPRGFANPVCIWGDHSTVVTVGHSDAGATASGEQVSLDTVAGLAAKLRADVRVEAER